MLWKCEKCERQHDSGTAGLPRGWLFTAPNDSAPWCGSCLSPVLEAYRGALLAWHAYQGKAEITAPLVGTVTQLCWDLFRAGYMAGWSAQHMGSSEVAGPLGYLLGKVIGKMAGSGASG